MISVQNLRQQLNGNRRVFIIWLILVTIISFQACKAKKIAREKEELEYAFHTYKKDKVNVNHYLEDTILYLKSLNIL